MMQGRAEPHTLGQEYKRHMSEGDISREPDAPYQQVARQYFRKTVSFQRLRFHDISLILQRDFSQLIFSQWVANA
jgi:hypothetical protein